jgi:hypothetical protein
MTENRNIQFIKPCRGPDEGHRELTPEYALQCYEQGKVVQINLDNCSLQRMEQLPENPSIEDAEKVGLLPLVHILQKSPLISLTALGVNEMPDKYISNSMRAYQNFCDKFWPGHADDLEATFRAFDETSTVQKVDFKKLSAAARCTYGMSYVAILQIQNIKLSHSNKSSEEQFEIYIHSMISLLDILNAFEVEIAKYAFWNLSANEINQLPKVIQTRRRNIKNNFTKTGKNIDKCRWLAFDAAMDIHWLSGSNLAEDLGVTLDVFGRKLKIDNWVGTNDHKLFNICYDIHWVYYEGSHMKLLAVTREKELSSLRYWKRVDQVAEAITKFRKKNGYNKIDLLLNRIDTSVEHIEKEICTYLESIKESTI